MTTNTASDLPPQDWAPICFREFWDVPRCFTVESGGEMLFFDCPFSEALDDYVSTYTVYRVPPDFAHRFQEKSWEGFTAQLTEVGEIPVSGPIFDSTRRAAIRFDVVRHLFGARV